MPPYLILTRVLSGVDILSEDHQAYVNLSFEKHEGTKGISIPSSVGMFICQRVTPTCERGVSPRSITHKRILLEVVFKEIKVVNVI